MPEGFRVDGRNPDERTATMPLEYWALFPDAVAVCEYYQGAMQRYWRGTPGSDHKVTVISEAPDYWVSDLIVEALGTRFFRGYNALGEESSSAEWFGIEASFSVCAFRPI